MFDLIAISTQLELGIIPRRPPSLTKPNNLAALSTDEIIIKLLEAGSAVAFGGISLIGQEGYVVPIISFLHNRRNNLHGWYLAINHPDHEISDFQFIDTSHAPLTEFPFPNTITYFVAETEPRLLDPNASPEELQSVAHFILPFISDEGPPKGIDW